MYLLMLLSHHLGVVFVSIVYGYVYGYVQSNPNMETRSGSPSVMRLTCCSLVDEEQGRLERE